MKTAAVISEFNPFHNGHKYILEKAKELTGADYAVAVMSGNFVQRGEPAMINKFDRARLALACGADLVLELPPYFSCASAADFAAAGVSLAYKSGVVDRLVFGSENADIEKLQALSDVLINEDEGLPYSASAEVRDNNNNNNNNNCSSNSSNSNNKKNIIKINKKNGNDDESCNKGGYCSDEPCENLYNRGAFSSALKNYLKEGASFPKAREDALKELGFSGAAKLVSSPNNILACEYLKALSWFYENSGEKYKKIEPFAVKRIGDGFLCEMPSDSAFTSATALRRLLLKGGVSQEKALSSCIDGGFYDDPYEIFSMDFDKKSNKNPAVVFSDYVPSETLEIYREILSDKKQPLLTADNMNDILNYRLIELMERGGDFTEFYDVPLFLSQRIKKTALRPMTFSDRAAAIKTKQYTYSRISRALLHIALGLKEEKAQKLKACGYVDHIRILGFRKTAAPLLKELKKNSEVPVVTKPAAFKDLICEDIRIDNIYYSLLAAKGLSVKNEYEREIVIYG